MTTGADSLIQTLADSGIDTCFANPGTTEMHLVAALGRDPRMTTHLCLFEGVATGAADGYARMTGRPAAVLLHLGPGLANGLANLHNARKAASPVVNIVGDHASPHLAFDAPLAADIEGMARTVSDLVVRPAKAADVAGEVADMLHEMPGTTGRVATVILPNDAAWEETGPAAPPARFSAAKPTMTPDAAMVAAAAEALRAGAQATLIIGAPALTRRMAELAFAISKATGCRLFTEAAVARVERGGATPGIAKIPFHVDLAIEALSGTGQAVLVGARAPVAFFAYPGRPSHLLPPDAEIIQLAAPMGDTQSTLEALAEALGAAPAAWVAPPIPGLNPEAPIDAETLATAVAAALPEGAIVVDESLTNGVPLFGRCASAPAHDWINNRGGSIGYSTPVAVGAAVACPERPVLSVTGDGSAFYTLQSLWTMARSRLNVTVVILANRRYRILSNEMTRIGAGTPDAVTAPLMSLENPIAQWTKLAEGQGVPAVQVTTAGALLAALKESLGAPGPRLIEAIM